MTLRYTLNRNWRKYRRKLSDAIWRLRLRAVYHLVGSKSFAANIDVVGTMHITNMVRGCNLIRDIYVFKNEKQRKNFYTSSQTCKENKETLT